jgi:hypothetical protein
LYVAVPAGTCAEAGTAVRASNPATVRKRRRAFIEF